MIRSGVSRARLCANGAVQPTSLQLCCSQLCGSFASVVIRCTSRLRPAIESALTSMAAYLPEAVSRLLLERRPLQDDRAIILAMKRLGFSSEEMWTTAEEEEDAVLPDFNVICDGCFEIRPCIALPHLIAKDKVLVCQSCITPVLTGSWFNTGEMLTYKMIETPRALTPTLPVEPPSEEIVVRDPSPEVTPEEKPEDKEPTVEKPSTPEPVEDTSKPTASDEERTSPPRPTKLLEESGERRSPVSPAPESPLRGEVASPFSDTASAEFSHGLEESQMSGEEAVGELELGIQVEPQTISHQSGIIINVLQGYNFHQWSNLAAKAPFRVYVKAYLLSSDRKLIAKLKTHPVMPSEQPKFFDQLISVMYEQVLTRVDTVKVQLWEDHGALRRNIPVGTISIKVSELDLKKDEVRRYPLFNPRKADFLRSSTPQLVESTGSSQHSPLAQHESTSSFRWLSRKRFTSSDHPDGAAEDSDEP